MQNIPTQLKHYLKRLATALIIVLLPAYAQAQFTGPITATLQGSSQITEQQTSRIRITWSGSSDGVHSNNPGQTYRVSSDEGVFLLGRSVLATNNRRISDQLIEGNINPFAITETLRIPRSVLAAAEQAGSTTIQYRRIFTDEFDANQASSAVAFKIVSSNSGVLSISRIDLRFRSGGISMVAETGQQFNATANVSYHGSGLLNLRWEIATTPGTNGTAVFKTLKTLRRFLGAGRKLIIESPTLPSQSTGSYILRLSVTSPEVEFEPLLLHYSIIRGSSFEQAIQTIRLITPPNRHSINEQSMFSWEPIASATQYQLEIYESPKGNQPLDTPNDKVLATGILLPSNELESTLTPLTIQHLKKGKTYYWRAVAIDANGLLVAKSEFRQVIFSP